jgi:hypothetical protein
MHRGSSRERVKASNPELGHETGKEAKLQSVPTDPARMAYASLPLTAMPCKWFLILAYQYAITSLYLLAYI